MSLRDLLLSTTILSMAGTAPLTLAVAQSAAPPPAVDGLNGKFEALGGGFATQNIAGGAGSVALPLQGGFGVQIDGALGAFGGHTIGVGAGHLFWRDPHVGLGGLYLEHTEWARYTGVHLTRGGFEGEYYWGQFTAGGIVGLEAGNDATHILTHTTTTTAPILGGGTTTTTVVTQTPVLQESNRFFDHVSLAYYPVENWKASIGHVYTGGKNSLALTTEYAMPIAPGIMASLFAEGRIGEGRNNYGGWGGIRFYFGQHDKTLMARQREDDPGLDWVPDSLTGIAQSIGSTTSGTNTTHSCPAGETFLNGSCTGL